MYLPLFLAGKKTVFITNVEQKCSQQEDISSSNISVKGRKGTDHEVSRHVHIYLCTSHNNETECDVIKSRLAATSSIICLTFGENATEKKEQS
jgi:hypothetical protein